MPEKETMERAREDKREGKAPSTQAGEFVREEIHHVREGKHGAKITKQAIAIGLSKARRAGVKLPTKKGSRVARRRRGRGKKRRAKPSAKRSRAVEKALKRAAAEGGVVQRALSGRPRRWRRSARRRTQPGGEEGGAHAQTQVGLARGRAGRSG